MRHMYYGNPKAVNLDALREDADEIRRGARRGGAENVIIHHHLSTAYCIVKEPEDKSEYFHEFFLINTEVSNGEG